MAQDCTHIDTGLVEGRGKWNRQKSLLAIVGKEQVTTATKLKVFDGTWHCLLVLPLPGTQLVRCTDLRSPLQHTVCGNKFDIYRM